MTLRDVPGSPFVEHGLILMCFQYVLLCVNPQQSTLGGFWAVSKLLLSVRDMQPARGAQTCVETEVILLWSGAVCQHGAHGRSCQHWILKLFCHVPCGLVGQKTQMCTAVFSFLPPYLFFHITESLSRHRCECPQIFFFFLFEVNWNCAGNCESVRKSFPKL